MHVKLYLGTVLQGSGPAASRREGPGFEDPPPFPLESVRSPHVPVVLLRLLRLPLTPIETLRDNTPWTGSWF